MAKKPLLQRLNELEQTAIRTVSSAGGLSSTTRGGSASILPAESRGSGRMPAMITGSTMLPGHQARWLYDWKIPVYTSGVTTTMIYSLQSPSILGVPAIGGRYVAVNLVELAHAVEPAAGTPWYCWGIDCHNTLIGAVLRPRPVGGGGTNDSHKRDVPAEIIIMSLADGTPFFAFYGWGSVEAVCNA